MPRKVPSLLHTSVQKLSPQTSDMCADDFAELFQPCTCANHIQGSLKISVRSSECQKHRRSVYFPPKASELSRFNHRIWGFTCLTESHNPRTSRDDKGCLFSFRIPKVWSCKPLPRRHGNRQHKSSEKDGVHTKKERHPERETHTHEQARNGK